LYSNPTAQPRTLLAWQRASPRSSLTQMCTHQEPELLGERWVGTYQAPLLCLVGLRVLWRMTENFAASSTSLANLPLESPGDQDKPHQLSTEASWHRQTLLTTLRSGWSGSKLDSEKLRNSTDWNRWPFRFRLAVAWLGVTGEYTAGPWINSPTTWDHAASKSPCTNSPRQVGHASIAAAWRPPLAVSSGRRRGIATRATKRTGTHGVATLEPVVF